MAAFPIAALVRKIRTYLKAHRPPSVTQIALQKRDPFRVLIACLLSLRTKDAVTHAASSRLFALADTPKAMLKLSEKRIAKTIYPAGFYLTKSKRIREISQALLKRFDGQVPSTIDELLGLKGVGRKTANLVLVEGFQKHGICVDTHVHRISNRLGYVLTKTPEQTEMRLRQKLPLRYWKGYNEWLVRFGQIVCVPISPHCSDCPVRGFCARRGVERSR